MSKPRRKAHRKTATFNVEKKSTAVKSFKPKLTLSSSMVGQCRKMAREITAPVQDLICKSTTVAIERTTLRLLGVEGCITQADGHPMPYVNVVVDQVRRHGLLHHGVLKTVCHVMAKHNQSLDDVVMGIAKGEIDLGSLSPENLEVPKDMIREMQKHAMVAVKQLIAKGQAKNKSKNRKVWGNQDPLRYVIVATGNIHEDVTQAISAAKNGADIIAVIRSTAQSLLDYVPDGLTTMGFGGTYATQANFRLMRKALHETSAEIGRYIHLTNYSSGLCMPEIAAMAALEDLDMLLNDAMYGILFRDINMKRTFIDQYFSRLICSVNSIFIQTGEDNYLTTADAYDSAHHVLASQFVNESFALRAKISPTRMCLGHAFEMDPKIEDGFLYEVAQAQMIRQIFPTSPIKYMPPTKHKQGDFFWSNLYDGMFNVCGQMTGQTIQLLGMATESLHNPMMHDRYWSLKNANYIFNNTRHLGEEIVWKKGGRVEKRAQEVLSHTHAMLKRVKKQGLMGSISRGWFADVKRAPDGGRGLEGVCEKDFTYFNPVWDALELAAKVNS